MGVASHAGTHLCGCAQLWFDTPQSLAMKYRLAGALGLRGVGFWFVDALDHLSQDARVRQQTQEMWAALKAFTKHTLDK